MPKSKVKEQWAAIVWKSGNGEKINKKGETSLCDIVDLTCVPKKYRTEGCIASLKWIDTSTSKTSYHKAEVLKISSDKEALELLIGSINSNTGKIDPSEKIFSSEILEKRKEQQQGKKIRKIAQNKASTQVAAEIAKDTSIFDNTSVNDTLIVSSLTSFSALPSTPTVNSPLISQETHPPLTTSNAFSVLPSTATANSPLTSQETHPPLTTSNALNFCPSTAQSIQALLPSSCTSFTDLNYTATLNQRYSRPTTYSSVTENSQCFSTMTTPLLPLPTQQYFNKLTAQEQPKHRSTSQVLQSSEPLQSRSQLADSKDKLKRFMDAFMALGPEVTETNIKFFETVVTAMKSTYVPENIETSTESSFKISDFYTSPGKGKVEIYPGTNFYFYEGIKANIMDKSKVLDQKTLERVNHWPLLVRHALIEVYGKNLASFCAKGSKKDGRPGIDAQFYKALYYWACDWNGGKITEEKFIDNINKTAYNKRKARNQAQQILKIPKKDAEIHPKPGATDNQTKANITS